MCIYSHASAHNPHNESKKKFGNQSLQFPVFLNFFLMDYNSCTNKTIIGRINAFIYRRSLSVLNGYV